MNPIVTVQLTRSSLPTFFSRIWGNTGNSVSATATAEAFNPSNSGNSGNRYRHASFPCSLAASSRGSYPIRIPAQHQWRCRNLHRGGRRKLRQNCQLTDGSIVNHGHLFERDGHAGGIIGETFWLVPDCRCQQSNFVYSCDDRQPEGQYATIRPHPASAEPDVSFRDRSARRDGCSFLHLAETNSSGQLKDATLPRIYTCGVASAQSGGTNAVDLNRAIP